MSKESQPAAERGRHRAIKEHRVKSYIVSSLAAAAIGAGIWYYPLIKDIAHDASPQEALIEAGVARAGKNHISIRCLNNQAFNTLISRVRPDVKANAGEGFTIPYIPLVWLKQGICDQAAGYTDHAKSKPTKERLKALVVLTHELQHVDGETSEQGAECKAVQELPWMVAALGQTYDNTGVEYVHKYYGLIAEGQIASAKGYELTDCYKGGPYDLHLAEDRYTVVFPPKSIATASP
jgi:hypothetical protein